jgi:hypothetical protein
MISKLILPVFLSHLFIDFFELKKENQKQFEIH